MGIMKNLNDNEISIVAGGFKVAKTIFNGYMLFFGEPSNSAKQWISIATSLLFLVTAYKFSKSNYRYREIVCPGLLLVALAEFKAYDQEQQDEKAILVTPNGRVREVNAWNYQAW